MGMLGVGIGGALGGAAIGGAVGANTKHPWEDYSSAIMEGAAWGAGIGGVGAMGAWGLGRKALRAGKKGLSAAERGLNKAAGVAEEVPTSPLEAKAAAKAARRRGKVVGGAQEAHARMKDDWRFQAKVINRARRNHPGVFGAPETKINAGRSDKGAIGKAIRRAKAHKRLWRRRRNRKANKKEYNRNMRSAQKIVDKMDFGPPLAEALSANTAPLKGGYRPANMTTRGQWYGTMLMDIKRTGRLPDLPSRESRWF